MGVERCKYYIQAKSPDLFPPVLCDATDKSKIRSQPIGIQK